MGENKTQAATSKLSSQQAQQYKALDQLRAFLHLTQQPEWQEHLLPYLRAWLVATPPRPQDFKDRDQFFDGYSLYLAKVDTARDFMSQFDPANIEARIKDLNQQLARQGL